MTGPGVDYKAFQNAKYFPSLDGMRALCVLLVLFTHVHVPVPDWILGSLGVDVFFVLSGFLITTLLLREKERTDAISLVGFYIRRFFRIIPVYLFTVFLYFVALRASHDAVKTAQFISALPWLLSFMQEYRPLSTGYTLGHSWTLGIEEKFYIVWPLLLMVLFPFRARAWLCMGCLFVALLFLRHDHARAYDGLLIGALVAVSLSAEGRWGYEKIISAIPDAFICLLLVGTYALNGHSKIYVLLFSAATALLVSSLVLRTGFVRRFLELPLLIFVGKRSYAMYLIHVLMLNVVEKVPPRFLPPNWLLIVGIGYLLSIAGASLIYVAIERPCIGFGRTLSKRWDERHARKPVTFTRP
jgi:peptidoglycan/LPS O-acetylase OafA/YrhL